MGQRHFRACGNQAKLLHELITGARRQAELIGKDGNIRQNQQDVDDGEAAARRFAAKRYHSGFTYYFKNASLSRARAEWQRRSSWSKTRSWRRSEEHTS